MHATVVRMLRVATGGLILAALVSVPAAAAAGRVLVVDVDEPFVIDGRTYGPAALSFRQGASFTPSTAFDEIRVDGTSLGLLPVRNSRTEGRVAGDAVVFTRDPRGRLVLLGYIVGNGESAGSRRFVARSGSGAPAWDDPSSLVVLAAR